MGLKENYERRKADEKDKKKQEQALSGFGRKTFRHPDRIIRYAWWLGAFTLWLVIVGAIQSAAFITSERAIVAVSAVTINSPGDSSPLIVTIDFKNAGRSTATASVDTFFSDKQLPVEPDYIRGIQIGANSLIIPPGGVSYVGFKINLSSSEIASIRGGQTPLNLYGIVRYIDEYSWIIFYAKKTIGFCVSFDATGNPAVSLFGTCKQRNYIYAD